jgi:hypothetical protein
MPRLARHLHLDPFAGIAGDMLLGALVDLGASLDAIDAALRPLDIQPDFALTARPVSRLIPSHAAYPQARHER